MKDYAMNRETGVEVITSTAGESFKAFVPHPLPPSNPVLDPASYEQLNQTASLALARLNGVSGLVQSVDWLIYSSIRKEALLTSQIEGTQATLRDLFDVEAHIEVSNPNDVEEVVNYVKAFQFVRGHLNNKHGSKSLPISTRLICEAHALLMQGARGANKQPGSIRQSQNWIGGTQPKQAVFVPPPPQYVPNLLGDLEKYIHGFSDLPVLVQIALVHVQFETIHPFLDGNGRIGRLLIAAMMEHHQLLNEPLLYVSATLKRYQMEYYRHLAGVRLRGDWEAWVRFFLEVVMEAAKEAEQCVVDIASLINSDRRKLTVAKKVAPSAYRLFECLPSMPRFSIEQARRVLDCTVPTATAAVTTLVQLGILNEQTGKKKNRSFDYAAYIDRLSL
jgi:Fic family protein